jgi:hypothetical protein
MTSDLGVANIGRAQAVKQRQGPAQGTDEKLGGSDPAQRQANKHTTYTYTDRSGKIRKNDSTKEGKRRRKLKASTTGDHKDTNTKEKPSPDLTKGIEGHSSAGGPASSTRD